METFITVRSFVFAPQAQMYQSYLESEGIFVFLKDELTVQSQPLWSSAVGGVKLQVRIEDKDRALELIRLLDSENGITATDEADDVSIEPYFNVANAVKVGILGLLAYFAYVIL